MSVLLATSVCYSAWQLHRKQLPVGVADVISVLNVVIPMMRDVISMMTYLYPAKPTKESHWRVRKGIASWV